MSFGGPGGANSFIKPTPPERGSFPLDHDGECKEPMLAYMSCIQTVRGSSRIPPDCRLRAQDYLNCRMERGLMRRDEWKNLGLPGYSTQQQQQPAESQIAQSQTAENHSAGKTATS